MTSSDNSTSRSVRMDIVELNYWKDELGWSNDDLARAADVERRTIERMYKSGKLGRRAYATLLENVQRVLIEKAERIGIPEPKYPHTLKLLSEFRNTVIESSVDTNYGAIAVGVAVEEIELLLPDDTLEDFTPEKRDKLLKAVQLILGTNREILVTGYREGSVKITIAVSPSEAERLLWEIKSGNLKSAGVKDAEPFVDTAPDIDEQGEQLDLTNARAEAFAHIINEAQKLYKQTPGWITFFHKILGVDGLVRRELSSAEKLEEFEHSSEYELIQLMLAKLRQSNTNADEESEPSRVISVRLPESLLESLRSEAHKRHISMNMLCVSMLLQSIAEEPATRRQEPTPANLEICSQSGATYPESAEDCDKHLNAENPDVQWSKKRCPK